MTQTLALTVNVVLGLAAIGVLALAVRLAHRPPAASDDETLHPSKPLPLTIVHAPDADELARAA